MGEQEEVVSPDGLLHKAVFVLRDTELTWFVSSLDDEESKRWEQLLSGRVRLPSVEKGMPEEAFSYYVVDQSAVLVRHWYDVNEPLTRTARALIGAADVLTPSVALGLDRWSGWEDALEDPMTTTTIGELRPQLRSDSVLREAAHGYRDHIAAILSTMVEKRDARVAVTGCELPSALAVLWALHRCGAPFLADRKVDVTWSFTTWHSLAGIAAVDQPDLVVAKGRLGDVGGRTVIKASRRRARLDQDARAAVDALLLPGSAVVDPDVRCTEALRAAVGAPTAPDFLVRLAELERATATTQERAAVRAQASDSVLAALTSSIDDVPQDLRRRLIEVLFGADGSDVAGADEAAELALWAIASSPSEEFARTVARIPAIQTRDRAAQTIVDRFIDSSVRSPAARSTASTEPVVGERLWGMDAHGWRIVAMGCLVLVMVCVVLTLVVR